MANFRFQIQDSRARACVLSTPTPAKMLRFWCLGLPLMTPHNLLLPTFSLPRSGNEAGRRGAHVYGWDLKISHNQRHHHHHRPKKWKKGPGHPSIDDGGRVVGLWTWSTNKVRGLAAWSTPPTTSHLATKTTVTTNQLLVLLPLEALIFFSGQVRVGIVACLSLSLGGPFCC